jgi:hypothetical protein
MKRTDKFFGEIYKIDELTSLYMIEIALDQYSDMFNQWDPAPFKRRDIDPDLKLYLEESSDEIPFQYPIELCFTVPAGTRDERVEEESRNGLRNSFAYKMYFLKKELRKTNARMLQCVFIGFGFLWIGKTLSKQFEAIVLLSLMAEGLFIGGWVFLWEAVSLFFFSNRDLYHRYRTYKRLQTAPMVFREATPS